MHLNLPRPFYFAPHLCILPCHLRKWLFSGRVVHKSTNNLCQHIKSSANAKRSTDPKKDKKKREKTADREYKCKYRIFSHLQIYPKTLIEISPELTQYHHPCDKKSPQEHCRWVVWNRLKLYLPADVQSRNLPWEMGQIEMPAFGC